MMSGDQDHDRSEPATPHKLAEARKRGRVARSPELTSAIVFATAVATVHVAGASMLESQFRLDRLLLAAASTAAGAPEALVGVAIAAIVDALVPLAPLFLVLMAAAVVGSVAQTGGVFALQSLQPDWSRLDPVRGLRRLASWRALFDTGRSVVKLLVLAAIVYGAWADMAPRFHQLALATPASFLQHALTDAATLGLRVAAAFGLIAVVDLVFTRREFGRTMRMSRREVRDEARQREGDPRIRSRLRQLRRQLLDRSRAVRRTAQADLVVTNPTHVAVALAYRHGEMTAPRIVAKGAGAMAAAMRAVAHRHAVPVVLRPTLARALYAATDVDDTLPETFYRDVAQLMVWVISLRRARDQQGGARA